MEYGKKKWGGEGRKSVWLACVRVCQPLNMYSFTENRRSMSMAKPLMWINMYVQPLFSSLHDSKKLGFFSCWHVCFFSVKLDLAALLVTKPS